ncbi:HAMP domain-containing sensor histidine kinase [Tsukamurella spumae]|uniref:histidine kinase n=1 Tax=Tsukamurella spumae TaxID=44753 RepID=A0A846X1B9_9ACTN|nr:HAMP domain-containing sensor histidine kinase [Tsukamurella spumae]NKY18911.1 HAMP domain-containing histidine kinase [Tsukamurella spumae]
MRHLGSVRMRLALLTGVIVFIGYAVIALAVIWLLTDVVLGEITPATDVPPSSGAVWGTTGVSPVEGPSVPGSSTAFEVRQALSEWGRIAVLATAPLAGAISGLIAWFVAGRVLRPVGAIEQRFRELSSGDLSLRVPEPAGDDEVARLARTMNDTLELLQESSDRQLRFVADAAHELRGPIGAVRADLEVAAAYPDQVDPVVAVREALLDVDRLQSVATDLLTLARLEAGEKPKREILPLFEVLGPVRPPTDVAYTVDVDPATLVVGSRQHVTRLLQNLVDNAARHARSAVSFTVREVDGAVVLDVDDDGPGIAPEDREQVFTPFLRLDEGRSRDDGGSGLGLAIAAEIVRAHEGTIRVGEAPSGGARLRVELPAPAPIP